MGLWDLNMIWTLYATLAILIVTWILFLRHPKTVLRWKLSIAVVGIILVDFLLIIFKTLWFMNETFK